MPAPRDTCIITTSVGSTIDFSQSLNLSIVKGRVALITGGASGLGLAIAKSLARHGAHVAIADLADGRDVEQKLVSEGLSAKYFKVDATSWESQSRLFKSVIAWMGSLDMVIPSAGLSATDIRTFIKSEGDPVKPPTATFDVNFTGVYFSAYLALAYFDRLRPAIAPQLLLISSLAGYASTTSWVDYCGSKHAVRAMFKVLRGFAADCGHAQVNLLAPTYIETPMTFAGVPSLKEGGAKVGHVDDAVAAAMRAICDPAVYGRAICVVAGNPPGSNNYDLNDDLPGGDGSRQLSLHIDKFGDMLI